MQRSGEKHNIALHSNNPRMEIPSAAPASHPGISCSRGVSQGFRSEVCAPGEVLEDTHSPHSVHSWPARDLLVPGGVSQPQEFLCAFFSPLGIPGKQTLPGFTSFFPQLCCLWVVEIATSHFGKGWIVWDWSQPKSCWWKVQNGSQDS